MSTDHEYIWHRPYHGDSLTTLRCEATATNWDQRFPRYYVRYGGTSGHRSVTLHTQTVAERAIAEQQAAILRAEGDFRDMFAEIIDMGSAPYPEFGEGVTFYAADGRKGFITLRNRDSASVRWDDDPDGGLTYALGLMRTTPPQRHAGPYSMNWLRMPRR